MSSAFKGIAFSDLNSNLCPNHYLGELADGREDLGHGSVLDVVVVDAVQHDVDDVHEEVDEGAAALGDQQLDQVQDLRLAPRQHMVRDVDVEGLGGNSIETFQLEFLTRKTI